MVWQKGKRKAIVMGSLPNLGRVRKVFWGYKEGIDAMLWKRLSAKTLIRNPDGQLISLGRLQSSQYFGFCKADTVGQLCHKLLGSRINGLVHELAALGTVHLDILRRVRWLICRV